MTRFETNSTDDHLITTGYLITDFAGGKKLSTGGTQAPKVRYKRKFDIYDN